MGGEIGVDMVEEEASGEEVVLEGDSGEEDAGEQVHCWLPISSARRLVGEYPLASGNCFNYVDLKKITHVTHASIQTYISTSRSSESYWVSIEVSTQEGN